VVLCARVCAVPHVPHVLSHMDRVQQGPTAGPDLCSSICVIQAPCFHAMLVPAFLRTRAALLREASTALLPHHQFMHTLTTV
jgi:hypothetical protein